MVLKKKQIKIRLYYAAGGILRVGGEVALSGGQAHYIRNVMRAKLFDPLVLFDGVLGELLCEIISIEHKTIKVKVKQLSKEYVPTTKLTLCTALIRSDVLRSVIRQATEMGVTLIQPIRTEYSVVTEINFKKCQLWAIEASEQCGRQDIPNIAPVVDFYSLSKLCKEGERFVLCDETGFGMPAGEVLYNRSDVRIIIGPEGGFSHDELRFAETFCDKMSLGPRILRVDTAVVTALAYVNEYCC